MTDKVTVKPMDPSLQNSPMAEPNEHESTVILDSASDECIWNDETFADGAVVECDGVAFECSFGRWAKN